MGRRGWDKVVNMLRATRESRGAERSLASPRPSRKGTAHLHAAQPLPDRQEGLPGCEVVHNNHAVGLSEELLGDTAIPATGEPASGRYIPSLGALAWDLGVQHLTSPAQQCPTAVEPPVHCPP